MVEHLLVDGDGSECGGCNVDQVTPSSEIRECANGKCVKDACGCWIALLETEEGTAQMMLDESMAFVASMVASMASNGGFDGFDGVNGVDGGGFGGVDGGFDGLDGWRRWWLLGSSTQRALTWKSLCVPK